LAVTAAVFIVPGMFQKLINNFRKTMEQVIMQNCLILAKLNVVKAEVGDLKSIIYEKEFKRLSYSISYPIKDIVVKYFRQKQIRMDPLEECLLKALLKNDWYSSGISKNQFNEIIDLYKNLSKDFKISNYKDIISIMHYRYRNIEEHEKS
jgi:hypothetical protein